MYTLKSIRKKVTKLELEQTELLAELEDLKKQAQTKIESLTKEIKQLRTETKTLKKLLDTI